MTSSLPTSAPASPTCALCPRPPAVGRLCWRDRDRLADLLNPQQTGTRYDPARPDDAVSVPSIPVLFALLDAGPRTAAPAVVTASAFGSRSPADDGVIALRDPRSRPDEQHGAEPVLPTLLALAARVDRRDLHGRRSTPPRPHTVAGVSRWLYGAVDWLAAQPWVEETYRELRRLSGALRAAVGDAPPRAVGTCRVLVDRDGHPDPAGPYRCAWPLYVPVLPPRADDDPIEVPALRCGSCGHRYSGPELVALGRDLHAAVTA